MAEPPNSDRNPFVIPDKVAPARRVCPKCKESNYRGDKISGVITFRCESCGNKWEGGLPQEPEDPRVPRPPVDPKDVPMVDFVRNPRTNEVEELRLRRADPTQAFRRGAPIKGDEDV